jgi:hypothetical protein
MSEIQEHYGPKGLLKSWDKMCQIADPEYAKMTYDTFVNSGLFPKNLDGFVFLSPSANMGSKEIGIAQLVDKSLAGKDISKKPLFVASDFFGTHVRGGFKPGFDRKLLPSLENVSFSFLSADANRLPIQDASIDIIMDRMGAVWHTINKHLPQSGVEVQRLPTESTKKAQQDLSNLLIHYSEKIKADGMIVIDAPDDGRDSSERFLSIACSGDIESFLNKLDLTHRFVGEYNARFVVIFKIKQAK